MTGVADLPSVGRAPRSALARDDPGVSGSDGQDPAPVRSDLARVGALPANAEVLHGALRLVAVLVKESIRGADGVSISLARHDRLSTIVFTNDTVLEMDAHQYDTGEGPCVAAATEGRLFHVESVAAERRWPRFIQRARRQGIASILSVPLVAERPLGALNVYSEAEGAFGARDQQLGGRFASHASELLVDAGAGDTDQQVRGRVLSALRSRQLIAHAQGVLMERRHVVADAVAADLHREARDAGQSMVDHAAAVVESTTPGHSDPSPSDPRCA